VVAGRYLSKWQTLLATVLFAISDPLIRYSTEVKQYSGDVFFTLAIYWCVHWFMQRSTRRRGLLLGALGTVAVWTSYPVSFVVAGVGTALAAMQFKQKKAFFLTFLPILSWATAIAALIFLQLMSMAANRPLLELYGRTAFVPAQVSALLPWLRTVGYEFTMFSLGLGFDPSTLWYGTALILLGAFTLARKN